MAMYDDRKSLVSFKPVEPTKPASGIDPELLDDDGQPLPFAAQARLKILDRMRRYKIEPGSDVYAAIQRHMRPLVREELRKMDAGTDLVRKLLDNPKLLDRNHLRAV